MKYIVIHKNSSALVPVSKLCQIFNVSTSGFYKWRALLCEVPHPKSSEFNLLESNVVRVFFDSKRIYGVRKVHHQLNHEGIALSSYMVHKIMNKNNLVAKSSKPFKPQTTDSNHGNRVSPRLFKVEESEITKTNQIWAGDITYLPTKQGWLYLSVFLDLFSRRVIGWDTADHLRAELVRNSFVMALKNRPTPAGLIVHTDRGVQYTAVEFRNLLDHLKLNQSMSRKGNCYDNSYVESFFAQLKKELADKVFETRDQARKEIFNFINSWYNTVRIHSSLGYISPVKFEQNYEAFAS